MPARREVRSSGHETEFFVPEERRGILYEVLFNIFARHVGREEMRACICELASEDRASIEHLCKELRIDPNDLLRRIQGRGFLAGVEWTKLIQKGEHPRSDHAPGYVIYFFLHQMCVEKRVTTYRGIQL